MTALVGLTTEHRIQRLSYLICGLHVLMLGPKDVVHACQHVTTSLIVRCLPEIIFLSYITRGSGVGFWRTFLRENELLVLTDQHDVNIGLPFYVVVTIEFFVCKQSNYRVG